MSDTISLHRWIAKKGARMAFGALSAPLCALSGLVSKTGEIRVLTYHGFADNLRAPFSVSPKEFERQIKWLKQNDLIISPDEFRQFLSGTLKVSGKKVLITIDDGFENVFDIALKVLTKHRASAILFAVPNWIGTTGFMDKSQLIELADNNIEIGSHSISHQSMARAGTDLARDEIFRSRHLLEDLIKRPVTAFAYPYGTLNDFNNDTRAMAGEAGYDLVFTSQHGPTIATTDALEIPRVKVEGGDPGWHFPVLAKGGMDAWRLVDRLGSSLQKPMAQ